jgi:hypothetical protein
MADEVNSSTQSVDSDREARSYEPPTLTHLGNARDLLAGSSGTATDAPDPLPTRPTGG